MKNKYHTRMLMTADKTNSCFLFFVSNFLNSCKTLNNANISLSLKQTLWLITQVSFVTFALFKDKLKTFFI
jgi:hypothetical protein